MRSDTKYIHAGAEPDPSTGAIMTPIYQTSTYVQAAPGQHKGYEYARSQNPTRKALEDALAAIENGKYALAFSSGVAATDNAKAIEASDDPNRDALLLVYTLEALSAATAQALVQQVSEPDFRVAAMKIGVRSARQSALVALTVNPAEYFTYADQVAAQPSYTTTTVATADTQPSGNPPLTEIPLPVAVPSQFGSLSGITYIGANGDENGVRLKLIFETPSLNSFVYPSEECSTTTA